MRFVPLLAASLVLASCANAPSAPPAPDDAALAKTWGADERGMRGYVLVILKGGPNKMAPGPERDAMFQGHFANIQRLADEGKLAIAGPTDNTDGWRGIFVFTVKDIEEAKALTATDPVIIHGEMVAEYHKLYATAGLMGIPDVHKRLTKKP